MKMFKSTVKKLQARIEKKLRREHKSVTCSVTVSVTATSSKEAQVSATADLWFQEECIATVRDHIPTRLITRCVNALQRVIQSAQKLCAPKAKSQKRGKATL